MSGLSVFLFPPITSGSSDPLHILEVLDAMEYLHASGNSSSLRPITFPWFVERASFFFPIQSETKKGGVLVNGGT